MNSREQRYLDAQKWIGILFLVALVGMTVERLAHVTDPGREVSIAAQSCWDRGLRAIMHRDGSIECRLADEK